MIFDSVVTDYAAEAATEARRNTEAFLAGCDIDRRQFEEFALRGFNGNWLIFYVSTVPRGLAGSKSDLDLILVPDTSIGADPGVSSMLFFRERRIGMKIVRQSDIEILLERARAALTTAPDKRLDAITATEKALPVKWADFERLVNGISFSAGAPYIRHLALLSTWTVHTALGEFHRQLGFASLAATAGDAASVYAYMQNSLVCAMDALMAACGRVQTNTKWTLQRWDGFRAIDLGAVVHEGVTHIVSLAHCFAMDEMAHAPDPAVAAQSLIGFFDRHICALSPKPGPRFALAPKTLSHKFLGEAVLLSREGKYLVADTSLLSGILNATAEAALDPDQAQLALALLAKQFLLVAGWSVSA